MASRRNWRRRRGLLFVVLMSEVEGGNAYGLKLAVVVLPLLLFLSLLPLLLVLLLLPLPPWKVLLLLGRIGQRRRRRLRRRRSGTVLVSVLLKRSPA